MSQSELECPLLDVGIQVQKKEELIAPLRENIIDDDLNGFR